MFVINELINELGHRNRDIEKSLNASSVLLELVKYDKTRAIFFEEEGKMIEEMIDLAIDPSNGPNQKYLMLVILEIFKQYAPES